MSIETLSAMGREIADLKQQLAEAKKSYEQVKGIARYIEASLQAANVRIETAERGEAVFAASNAALTTEVLALRARVEAKDAEIASLKAERDLEREYKIAECHRCEDYADDRKALEAALMDAEENLVTCRVERERAAGMVATALRAAVEAERAACEGIARSSATDNMNSNDERKEALAIADAIARRKPS